MCYAAEVSVKVLLYDTPIAGIAKILLKIWRADWLTLYFLPTCLMLVR